MNYAPDLIRLPDTLKMCASKRASFYNAMSQGLYPKPINIGVRAVAWIRGEIEEVLKARIAGQSEKEIKELVSKLTADRQKLAAARKHAA